MWTANIVQSNAMCDTVDVLLESMAKDQELQRNMHHAGLHGHTKGRQTQVSNLESGTLATTLSDLANY